MADMFFCLVENSNKKTVTNHKKRAFRESDKSFHGHFLKVLWLIDVVYVKYTYLRMSKFEHSHFVRLLL